MKQSLLFLILLISFTIQAQNTEPTYAEKLGYPKGKKVLIIHVDDVGMSYESNQGAIRAIKEGVANSFRRIARAKTGEHCSLGRSW